MDVHTRGVEEHDTLVVQVESSAKDALDKREEGERPLVMELDQLEAKLSTLKAQIEENKIAKEKLKVVITNCQKMKQLPAGSKVSPFIQENLKETLKEVTEELKKADNFLKQTTSKAIIPQKV